MKRILLVSDVHLMNHPDDLTEEEIRKQWSPALMLKSWVPLVFPRWVIKVLRRSAQNAIERLRANSVAQKCDCLVTLGDQCHGIAEKGIRGVAGRKVAREFLSRCKGITKERPLFHVPSEHPLGYWDGEDYLPHLKWKGGFPHPAWVIHRDIGGQLCEKAIQNWLDIFGPLWGARVVQGWKLIWFDCDLIRWRERIWKMRHKTLWRLLDEQSDFLYKELVTSERGRVLLFTHRPDVVIGTPFAYHEDRIRAVVFGDYHIQSAAAKKLAAFPSVPWEWWFVPALWGAQFGLGGAGFATLELGEKSARFQTHRL